MEAGSGKEKRTGIWYQTPAGEDKKLEGALTLKFYGREGRRADEPRCVFKPNHLFVPVTTEARVERGEEGLLIRFADSESYEEKEAIEQARRDEDAAQGEAGAAIAGAKVKEPGPDKGSEEYKRGFAQGEAALHNVSISSVKETPGPDHYKGQYEGGKDGGAAGYTRA